MVAIKKFATSISLLGNELLNTRLENRNTPPATPQPGAVWFDAIEGKFVFRGADDNIEPTNRAAHHGEQPASTISDFQDTVRSNRLDQLQAPQLALSIGGQKLTNVADGADNADGVNVSQLLGVVNQLEALEQLTEQGFEALIPARALMPKVVAASDENVTLNGEPPLIDGVQTEGYQWILLLGQTDPAENGLWFVIPADVDNGNGLGVWQREEAPEKPLQMQTGAIASVALGDTHKGTLWVYDNDSYATDGTPGTWTQLASLDDLAKSARSARFVAASNIDLASNVAPVVDQEAVADGDVVLFVSQTDPTENGLWQYNEAGSPYWKRLHEGKLAYAGTPVFVVEGRHFAGTTWTQTVDAQEGTEAVTFKPALAASRFKTTVSYVLPTHLPPEADGYPFGASQIDEEDPVVGSLVLLTSQNDPAQNGVWVARGNDPWTRWEGEQFFSLGEIVFYGKTSADEGGGSTSTWQNWQYVAPNRWELLGGTARSYVVEYVAATPMIIDGSNQYQSVDNGWLTPGDRALLTAQADAEENGVWIVGAPATSAYDPDADEYVVSPGTAWTRVDETDDLPAGTKVFVRNGQVYKGSTWTLQDNVATIGTSPQIWRADSRALYEFSARIAIHENIVVADNEGLGPVFYQGAPFVQGINFQEGDVVLLIGQTDGAQNGLWVAHPISGSPVELPARPWTRLFPEGQRLPAGTSVFVREGENAQQFYTLLYDTESGLYQTWQQVPRNRYKTTVDFVIDSYQINLADGYHEFFTPSELPNPPTGLALVNGQLDPAENGIYFYTKVADPLSSPYTTKYTFSRASAYDFPQQGDLLYVAGGKGMTRGTLWVQQASLGLPQTWGIVNRDVYEGYVTLLPLTDFGAAADDLDMAGFRIVNLADATANDNAVNLGQVTALVTQTSTDDRAYADQQDDAHSTADRAFTTASIEALTLSDLDPPAADLDINGKKLTNVAAGSDEGDAVNVGQFSSAIIGLSTAVGMTQTAFLVRQPVHAVATSNIALHTTPPLVDGVQLEATQWVLLTGQTNPAENGPWYIPDVEDDADAPGGVMEWRRRRPPENTYGEFVPPLVPGATLAAVDGGTYADTLWMLKSGTYGVTVEPTDAQTWGLVNVDRALATGTQLASTISDFDTQVRTSRLDQLVAPMTDLSIGSNKLTNVSPGTAATDAVNLAQLNAVVAGSDSRTLDLIPRAAATVDLNGQKITGLAAPEAPSDAVNRAFVESLANGIDWKQSVRAKSTGNVAELAGTMSMDSVTLDPGDRVLLASQTDPSQNGIWIVSENTSPVTLWTRAADASQGTLTASSAVMVEEGTTFGDSQWRLITNDDIVVGTTPLNWTQIGAAVSYVNGAGLDLTGNVFSLVANVPRKFSAAIGDGVLTSFVVNHNLGTRDVAISVYYDADGVEVECGVARTGTNSIALDFVSPPDAGSLRCVVVG